MVKKYLILFSFIQFLAQGQSVYYVNPSGSDQNDGMSAGSAWATIQKACETAAPNSTVLIGAGIYHENIQVTVSGTSGNPIIFRDFGDGPVIIDGEGTNGTSLLRITNRSWLHFENLEFRNLVRNNARGIMVETSQNGYSRNLSFKNITIQGIRWTAEDGVIPASGHNARGFAVVGRGNGIEYLSIIDCKIHDNVTGKSEALTINGNVEDFLIEGCSVHDNTNIGICLAGNYGVSNNPLLDKARNGIVRNNTCFNNISPLASSAGIYVDGGENIVIERNSSYHNGTGISVGCEQNGVSQYVVVRNNLIYDNLGRGLAVGGYTMLTTGQVLFSTFRNNTLYQNNSEHQYASEIHISKASNCVFEDNIVYANDQNIVLAAEPKWPQQDNLFNYNCFYTPSGDDEDLNIYWHELSFDNLADFAQATGNEINSVFGNPDWSTGSPNNVSGTSLCVDSGNPNLVTEPGELDFMGNPRLSGVVDIGAFEFTPALGIQDLRREGILYPNPVAGTVIYIGNFGSVARFSLCDFGGRKLLETAVDGNQIEIGDVPAGLYVYQIRFENGTLSSGKLIVARP